MGYIEVIARSFPCQPLGGVVLQHDHRDVIGTVLLQACALAANNAFDLGLQLRIERRLDTHRPLIVQVRQNHVDEMRRHEFCVFAGERQLFGARFIGGCSR